LSAAVELFAQQGVAATTFAMIADRAALTPAMLHYYFDDRERLLDAVVDERMAPVIARVWEPVTPDTPATVLIRGVVERLLDGIERMPWIPSTWIREVLNEGGMLRTRVLRQVPFDKVRIVSAAIQREQAARTLNRNVDPVLIIFSVLGLVMVHCATVRFWADTFHQQAPTRTMLQRHITSLVLDGLHGVARPQRQALHR
jgi:TetR/AcrR family transcriptional regulator